jgi:hypothetical protein
MGIVGFEIEAKTENDNTASTFLEEKLHGKGQVRVRGIALLDFIVPMS